MSTLSFFEAGEGETTFLLVHNAGGDHRMMEPTAEYCAHLGKVVSMDLRGHGQSDAPEQDYTLDAFAEDIAAFCKQKQLQKCVYIGLNYGANVGYVLAQKHPQFLSALILIEPPILMDPWTAEAVRESIEDLKTMDEIQFAKKLVESIFVSGTDQDKNLALESAKSSKKHVKISLYEDLLKKDPLLMKNPLVCTTPALCIQTSTPFTTEEKLKTCFSNLSLGRVVHSGPWATLEVPDQVHSMIKRFLFLLGLL